MQAAGPAARRGPGFDLTGLVQDGAQVRRLDHARRRPVTAVQHIDDRLGPERLAQGCALGCSRHEEGPRPLGHQPPGDGRGAQAIAVGLDDRIDRHADQALQGVEIARHGAEIDGEGGGKGHELLHSRDLPVCEARLQSAAGGDAGSAVFVPQSSVPSMM
ncbi:hypothetical protein D3C85_1144340 [compost metagenome]